MPAFRNAVDVEYGVTVTSFAFTIIRDRNFNPIREPTDSHIVSVRRVFYNPKRTEKPTISRKPLCPRDTSDVQKSQIQMVSGGAHTIDRRRRPVFLRPETNRTCVAGVQDGDTFGPDRTGFVNAGRPEPLWWRPRRLTVLFQPATRVH